MSAYDENHDAAPLRPKTDVKLRLRWFPGRYGWHYAEVGCVQLAVGIGVGAAKSTPVTDDAWICRAQALGVEDSFRGTRGGAQAHLEGLVRDRLIKALAAFGEEKTS